MNRMLRRLQRFGKRFSARRSQALAPDTSESLHDASTPGEVESPRAKSQGHGKVTADKWNQ